MKKFLPVILFITPYFLFSQSVVINEVMSSNNSTISDEFGEASDWIEFYNNGSVQVNLEGFYLSDDSLNINKWQFGNAVIEPGEYLVVFASDKDTVIDYRHTNFKISASGERIILSNPTGLIIDQVDVPESRTDVSYGRINDGSATWIFQEPSPGTKNTGNSVPEYSDPVTVSVPGGFYSSAVTVGLAAGGNDIYYTLDGSDPDENSAKYSNPITINETKVLRALSLKTDHLPSPIINQTYFINVDTDLPVISLISDPYNLFDTEYGIYTNYTMDWERPAHVEFFEDDKSPGFSENCGIEIYGSQSAEWAQKSITVKFKEKYGVSSLDYPLFQDFYIDEFKGFVLRNSGNDWQYTHIRDAVMQTLVKDLDIDYLEYRPAASFINGEYWGIYNIREKINEHYIASRHGVNPDSIDMLENNMEVIHGDSLSYRQLIDYISTNDITTDAAYSYLDSVIDLNECILYFAAQAYYDNMDWPGTNIKFWRERNAAGKWRWILFGLDFGFGLYSHGPSEDHIAFMFSPVETRYSNPPWATLLQRKLVENPVIRNRFINQIADLLNTNFKSERVIGVINSLANNISNEIIKHRSRWNLGGESTTKMTTFAQQRPAYLRSHVRKYFNCGEDGTLIINALQGGKVQLNSLQLESGNFPWSGTYFQNNAVNLKAIPEAGYIFNGWSGDISSSDQSLSLNISRRTNITADFSLDTNSVNDIVINEINYNSADDFDSGDWIELYNRSNHPVNIGNWYFSDSDDNHKFILQASTVLESKGYLVLVENDSAFASRFPDVKNYLGETGFGLNGSGEFMKLVNADGQIVDSLTYDDSLPWPIEADALGATLELVNPDLDNSIADNWKASKEHGTPGKINSIVTSVEENNINVLPGEFSLSQNYPNPFNPTTKIKYSIAPPNLPQGEALQRVQLKVYDVLGREIATLVDDYKTPGNYEVIFDASHSELSRGMASGVYFYRLSSGSNVQTKKLMFLK